MTCLSSLRLAPPARLRAVATRQSRAACSTRAGLRPQSQAELLLPWSSAMDVRAEGPPPMTPRFMDAAGPTDPMALLMRQRIVFLGTQARAAQ